MTTILHDTSRPAVVAAFEANWNDCIRAFGRAPQVEMHDEPDILWFITGIPSSEMNGVQHATLRAEDIDATVERVRARFAERRAPWGWLISPGSRPADLRRQLAAHGLDHKGELPGMALDLAAPYPPPPWPEGFTVEPVRDAETLRQWAEVEGRGFGVPEAFASGLKAIRLAVGLPEDLPMYHYLGRLDGVPMATSSLLLSAGVAGVYNVACLPQARRRGLGAAITQAALNEARRRGYRVAALQSSAMGYRVYQRLGFYQCCTFDVYG